MLLRCEWIKSILARSMVIIKPRCQSLVELHLMGTTKTIEKKKRITGILLLALQSVLKIFLRFLDSKSLPSDSKQKKTSAGVRKVITL